MGFMTEMSVLNDDWHRFEQMIREQPEELIRELRVLMNGRPQYGPPTEERPRGEYQGSLPSDHVRGLYLTVYQSHHADDARLYMAHQNTFMALERWIIEREYGERLKDEWLIDLLEKQIKHAEATLKDTKAYLKQKREALVAQG